MNNIKSSLKFIDYVVDKVEFYNNKGFDGDSIKISLDLDSKVNFYDNEDNSFEVTISAKIFDDAINKGYPFSMNVSLTGFFELENIDIDKKEIFAEKNAVTILFPYLRSLVSTYTANSNVDPLILPPINVVKYIEQKHGL